MRPKSSLSKAKGRRQLRKTNSGFEQLNGAASSSVATLSTVPTSSSVASSSAPSVHDATGDQVRSGFACTNLLTEGIAEEDLPEEECSDQFLTQSVVVGHFFVPPLRMLHFNQSSTAKRTEAASSGTPLPMLDFSPSSTAKGTKTANSGTPLPVFDFSPSSSAERTQTANSENSVQGDSGSNTQRRRRLTDSVKKARDRAKVQRYYETLSWSQKKRRVDRWKQTVSSLTPNSRGARLRQRRKADLERYRRLSFEIASRTQEGLKIFKTRRVLEITPRTEDEMVNTVRREERKQARSNESPYTKGKRLEKRNLSYKELTPTTKTGYLEKCGRWYHELRSGEKQVYKNKCAEGRKRRYENLTPPTKQNHINKKGAAMKKWYEDSTPRTKQAYIDRQGKGMRKQYAEMDEEARRGYINRAGAAVKARYRHSDEYRLKVKRAVYRRRCALRRIRIGQFKTTTACMVSCRKRFWVYSVISRLATSWGLCPDALTKWMGRIKCFRAVKGQLSKVLVLRARAVKDLLAKVKALETYLITECSTAELAPDDSTANEMITTALGRKRYHVRSWDAPADQSGYNYFSLEKDLEFPDKVNAVVDPDAEPLPAKRPRLEEIVDLSESILDEEEDENNSQLNLLTEMFVEDSDSEFEGYTAEEVQDQEAVTTSYLNMIDSDEVGTTAQEKGDKEKKKSGTPARACAAECHLPANWALRIYRILQQVKSYQNLPRMLDTLLQIETCKQCIPGGVICANPCKDEALDCCTDVLNLLRTVSPHYSGIRCLQSRYYEIRALVEWILDCDQVVNRGDYYSFRAFVRNRCEKLIRREEECAETRMKKTDKMRGRKIEEEVNEQYGHFLETFNAKINEFPTESCSLCDRLTCKSQLSSVKEDGVTASKGKLMWKRIVNEFKKMDSNSKWPKEICTNCLEQIKKGELPRYSFINGMGYVEPPKVIKELNDVEKTLVQKAKYLHKVIKLMPYSKRVAPSAATRGMKGFGFYMPLPEDDIKNSLAETVLPSVRDYEIIVDCHPTKQKVIWKYPVRPEKVVAALKHLQKANPLYTDITINERFEEQIEEHLTVITSYGTTTEVNKGTDDVPMEPGRMERRSAGAAASGLAEDAGETANLPSGLSEETIGSENVPAESSVQADESANLPSGLSDEGIGSGNVPRESSVQAGDCANLPSGSSVEAAERTDLEESVFRSSCPPGGRSARQIMQEEFELLDYVPSGQSLPGFSVKRIQPDFANKADTDLFRMSHLVGAPAYDDEKIEEKCFPELYVTGQFGYTYARERELRRGDYIKARLLHKSGAWRRNISYLFHARQWKDINNLKSGVYAMVSIGKTGQLTAGEFLKQVEEGNRHLEAGLSMMMSKLPNSVAFLNQKRTDLMAMDEALGPATFFVTLSCAEYNWQDMDKFLRSINSDLKGIATMPIGQLSTLDPVGVCKQFRHRFDALQEVLLAPDGPLGTVEEYVWRVEYQARGAPHLHGKLWIKDAPVIGKTDIEEVAKFVDKYITCELPERYQNPLLYELVTRYNTHKCTKSCRKLKTVQRCMFHVCRFGYPHAAMEKTKINSMEDVARAKGKKYRLPMIQLFRQKHERMINVYNPCLMMLWQANIDIQFIAESSFVLNRYITGYMSKSEKNAAQEAFEGIDQNKSLYSRLLSYGIGAVRDRELGSYEAADGLLNHPIFFASRQVVFVSSASKNERRRKLKGKGDIEGLPGDSTNIFCNNMVDTYYPNRPDSLEDVSLHSFVASYERIPEMTGKTDKSLSRQQYLKNGKGVIRERTKTVIVKSTYFQPGTNDYYRSLLLLHKPWRNEEELIGDCSTYAEAFKAEAENLRALAQADFLKTKLQEALEQLQEVEKRAAEQEAEGRITEEEEGQLWGEMQHQSDDDRINIIPNYTEDEVQSHLASLNRKQAEIVKLVTEKIRVQESHLDCPRGSLPPGPDSCPRGSVAFVANGCPQGSLPPVQSKWFVHKTKCSCEECDSLKLFVSGVAGTGKSHVIKALKMKIDDLHRNEVNDPAVLIAAPTGLAALNVDGTTIHKLLKLPVQHGGDPEYWPLVKEDVKEKRAIFRNARLLIIDEISMVSNITLAFIDHRLREIYQSEKLFGGMNVVVFGDLLQLKPVCSQFCYVPIQSAKMKGVFNTTYTYNLWNDFIYKELTENMRQREDLEFAEMLSRIRVGSPTEADIEKLKERRLLKTPEGNIVIASEVAQNEQNAICSIPDAADFYMQKCQEDPRALCLLSKNVQVDEFNTIVLEKLGITTRTVLAEDVEGSGNKKKQRKRTQKGTENEAEVEKVSDTGGLAREVKVGINCRVMLRRNVDLIRRLVNGSMGTITQLVEGLSADGRGTIVDAVYILFDGTTEPQRINRVTTCFKRKDGLQVKREQLPITVAYAVTVHKAQGLSLDNVLVCVDRDCFEDNMAYVALSRCRNIKGLYFLRLEPAFIHAFRDSWLHYNFLRRRFENSLGNLPALNENPYANQTMRLHRLELAQMSFASTPPTGTESRSKQVAPAIELMNSEYILRLRNDPRENACFVNALIQPLLRIDAFFEKLPSGFSPLTDELHRLHSEFKQKSTDVENVTRIRQLVDELSVRPGSNVVRMFSVRQHDVSEFIYRLFESSDASDRIPLLPPECRSLFCFSKTQNSECSVCGYKTSTTQAHSIILELPAIAPTEKRITFDDLLNLAKEPVGPYGRSNCGVCWNVRNLGETSRVANSYTFTVNQRYLIVLVPPFYVDPQSGEREKRKTKIVGFRANCHTIFGKKFKTVGAIKYYPFDGGEKGHYVSLVRGEKVNWIVADDSRISKVQQIFVPSLEDVMVLIMERLN